jgi:hypothetical protein
MSEPASVPVETGRQLFWVGQLFGSMSKGDDPEEVVRLVKEIDPDLLQNYLETHPEAKGFKYRKHVEEAIRAARTLKSFIE